MRIFRIFLDILKAWNSEELGCGYKRPGLQTDRLKSNETIII